MCYYTRCRIRKSGWATIVATSLLGVMLALPSLNGAAELQTVQVGGDIFIYGDLTRNVGTSGSGLRYPSSWLTGRPIGLTGIGNADGLFSWAGWDNDAADYAQITMWTKLHVRADFTDSVSAFIEFENLENWGEGFRSNYLTGADARDAGEAIVGLYQGYIDIAEFLGTPLQLRIGRQELVFGNEWLLGNNTVGAAPDYGLSYDALRVTYANDWLSLDAFAAKLAERLSGFGDDDTDFYGIYASYTGIEEHTLEAYWLWLRDEEPLEDLAGSRIAEWTQRRRGVDQYGATNLHTVGLRAAGAFGSFDYDVEAAYQFGSADHAGALFRPGFYGDDNARYDTWGLNSQIGYTFDLAWSPRLYLAYAYLGGEDNRDISFGDWLNYLVNPFYTPSASVSFNRLFSNIAYTYVIEATDMSNAHVLAAGVDLTPSEKWELGFWVTYLRTAAAFRRPIVPHVPFWTRENSSELGWQIDLSATYYYTEDLYLAVGWSHLFTGRGLREGHFNSSNGFDFVGGTGEKDADYAYFELGLSF